MHINALQGPALVVVVGAKIALANAVPVSVDVTAWHIQKSS